MSDSHCVPHREWHVIYTKPRQEYRALEQLNNQGYTCFLPTLSSERIHRGKIEKNIEPLFARYLFIQLNERHSNWAAIRNTRGVSRLVTFGDKAATLPDILIDTLQRTPEVIHKLLFKPGDLVEIIAGPLAGINAIYQGPDGATRALVLVEMMSQPHKLKIAVEMMRKTA